MSVKNTLDGWVSPVELIYKDVQKTFLEKTDEHIMARVESELGVKVNQDELIKAMNYDREQYEKGFENGYKQRDDEIIRCKDCKYFESRDYTYYKTTECENQHVRNMTNGDDMTIFCPEEDFYCPYGERKETDE